MFKGTASLTFAVTPCSLVRLHLLDPRAGAASWLTLGAPVPRKKLPLGVFPLFGYKMQPRTASPSSN